MKMNFKKPKYIIPIILLPFLGIFFYVAKSFSKEEIVEVEQVGLQDNLADVSDDTKNTSIANKLDAYRNQYKDADRMTAIENINTEQGLEQSTPNSYDRGRSDEASYTPYDGRKSEDDEALAHALNVLAGNGNTSKQIPQPRAETRQNVYREQPYETIQEDNPMEVFKQQMAFVDSMSKVNDPEYQAELEREKLIRKAEKDLAEIPQLVVEKADQTDKQFNTIKAEEDKSFIKAIVDENVKGYAGSRIRLRLLEDVKVGGHLVKRGTYVYAEITSFSAQRVGLSIQSIIKDNKIFPVTLSVYDLDGMPGLYIPDSEFREFSKELGGNSLQGMNMQSNPQNQSQFIMGAVEKMFTSTSSAIAKVIRKNKAKLKYNTFIYLINPKELVETQKTY